MKKIYKLLAVLLAIVTFSSCETYGDYDVEYSPIYPLSGEWIVNIYDANGQLLPDAEGYTCNTYNTADNVADKMWVKMSTASATWGILGKVNCNVQGLDFSGDNAIARRSFFVMVLLIREWNPDRLNVLFSE